MVRLTSRLMLFSMAMPGSTAWSSPTRVRWVSSTSSRQPTVRLGLAAIVSSASAAPGATVVMCLGG